MEQVMQGYAAWQAGLAIVEHLLKLILKDSGKKLKDDARAFKKLKVAAQKAKEDLSNANSASIVLDKLWDGDGGNFEYELTKEQFNKLIEPDSQGTLEGPFGPPNRRSVGQTVAKFDDGDGMISEDEMGNILASGSALWDIWKAGGGEGVEEQRESLKQAVKEKFRSFRKKPNPGEQVVRLSAENCTILMVNCTPQRAEAMQIRLHKECVEGTEKEPWLGIREGIVTVLHASVARPDPKVKEEPLLPLSVIKKNLESGADWKATDFLVNLICARSHRALQTPPPPPAPDVRTHRMRSKAIKLLTARPALPQRDRRPRSGLEFPGHGCRLDAYIPDGKQFAGLLRLLQAHFCWPFCRVLSLRFLACFQAAFALADGADLGALLRFGDRATDDDLQDQRGQRGAQVHGCA